MDDVRWAPVPQYDRVNGKNSNVYDAAIGHPTLQEKRAFLESLKKIIPPIAAKYQMPASALMAMACVESGYGFTRTALIANNFFGMKSYKTGETKWQLVGQPEEDEGQPVLEDLGTDRIIFDESRRTDNWYQDFGTIAECFEELISKWFIGDKYNKGYDKVCKKYQENRKTMPKWDASFQFIKDIANNGYCHLGGDIYLSKLRPVIDAEKLYLLDYDIEKPSQTKNKRVLIDPGHSDKKSGAVGSNTLIKEWEANCYQAKILKEELAKLKVDADIYDPSADDLYEIGAKAKGYDAFISLHLNAFDKKEHYTCTMVHPKYQPADCKSAKVASLWAQAVAAAIKNPCFEGTSPYPKGVMATRLSVLNAAANSGCKIAFLSEAEFIDDEINFEALKARLVLAMKAGATVLAGELT